MSHPSTHFLQQIAPTGAIAPLGWRGRLRRRLAQFRYRWQRGPDDQSKDQFRQRERWRRLRLLGLLGLFVGLLGLLVYELWFRPIETPIVTLSAPAYAWPVPPQAWSLEDVGRLSALESQGSVHVLDAGGAWRTSDSALGAFERQLRLARSMAAGSGALVIYVSMVGVVDENGEPALVPPGGSPLRSDTWLKVSDLLDRIKAERLPDEWHKLVVLDANRVGVNWSMGLVANTFAERLPAVVAAKQVPNLVVLNSCAPGQIAWASKELAGSVLAHYLQLGLAGAADDKAEGGNGDHQVSLHELRDYLRRHVDGWAMHNRADHQTPMIIPETAGDFNIVWALNKSAQSRLAKQPTPAGDKTDGKGPNVDRELTQLWQAHDRLGKLDLPTLDPLGFSELEHKLLWLEQAAVAGDAYKSSARVMLREVKSQLATAEERAGKPGDESKSRLTIADLLSDRPAKSPEIVAHSLPLAALLGAAPSDASQLIAQLSQLEKAPSEALVNQLVALTKDRRDPQLVEVQLARLLKHQLGGQAWQHPATIGQAFTAQMAGEKVAAPADERVAYWIAPVIAGGDRANRQGRDGLFAADAGALAAADGLLGDAQQRFDQARQLSKQAAEAYALRDRAFAELPYLAGWLARPLAEGQPTRAIDNEINDTLLPLIYANRALAKTLAAPEAGAADDAADAPAFQQQARQVREGLDKLHKSLSDECDRLQKLKKPSGQAARDVMACLTTPLLAAGIREDLRKLQGRMSDALNAETDSALRQSATRDAEAMPQAGHRKKTPSAKHGDGAAEEPDDAEAPDYWERCAIIWQQHPALALLATDDSTAAAAGAEKSPDKSKSMRPMANPLSSDAGGSAAKVAHQSGKLRDALDRLPARLRRLRDQVDTAPAGNDASAPPSDSAKAISLAKPRAAAAQADQLARAAASIGLAQMGVDPVRRLRLWDTQQLLLWHSSRMLDDFWGAAPGQSDPFFALAAGDYLRDAQALGEIDPAMLGERNRLARLLERRRNAARAGVHLAASDVLLIDEADTVPIKLGVSLTRESSDHGAPTEHVTVYVRDDKGRIEGATQSLDLPVGAGGKRTLEPIEFKLPTSALEGRGPQLEAVALLRTNQFVTPFLLEPTGGPRIDVKAVNYGSPEVTVAGRSRRRASIIFILDCSGSMSEMTELETAGGTQRLPRMEAAKIALRQMLAQLAEEGDSRVGVFFYGHRVGWNLKRPTEMMRQTEYTRTIPDDLRPSEDVEQVLPLGRFDPVVAGGVYELMKSVKPWGETPLYLSIIQAVGNFSGDEPDTEKSIIVITDGANYQFNSPTPKKRDDVLTAMGGKKIPVHIIGFSIPAGEAAEASRDFNALAEQTGGSYSPVATGTSVVRALENLLGPKAFTVFDPTGSAIGQAQVGQSVAVTPKPARPSPYTVAFGPLTERFELAGGETAEFILSADGKSLDALGYMRGDPVFGPLVAGDTGLDTEWRLGVHRPVRNSTGARFPLSVQRSDHQFTSRPAETWIEVTPMVEDRRVSATPYIYYDSAFLPRTTVPVLDLFADGWPAEARQAEVRAWVKYNRTKPDWTVKLREVANQLPANGTGATLEGLPGVTYQVRTRRGITPGSPLRVAVIERHSEESPGLGCLKVDLDPPPSHVVHRFDTEHHLATHVYEVDAPDDQTAGNYELHFTRRETAQAGAMQLAEPIVRRVTEGSDVIRGGRDKSASVK